MENKQENLVRELAPIHTYDIWVANLPTRKNSHVQHGSRPVVVVSGNTHNENSPVVTVVPLTSQRKKTAVQSHVYLSKRTSGHENLLCDSIALCEQVLSVDKRQLKKYVGSISNSFERMAIQHALAVHLNLVA